MTRTQLLRLRRLAQLEGIQISYQDMAGQKREASVESLKGVLRALGLSMTGRQSIQDAWRESRVRRARRVLEPVYVAWEGQNAHVGIQLPDTKMAERPVCRLMLEDGSVKRWRLPGHHRSSQERVRVEGITYLSERLRLPRLPLGYHRLEVESGGAMYSAVVIAAPNECHSEPAASRRWGVFLPVYSAHSERSWGAGNFGDFKRVGEMVGRLGGDVLASLPLTAAFLSRPSCEPSPYSPASRLFWNEFYVDVEAVPELAQCRSARELINSRPFQRRVDKLRTQDLVDYEEEAKVRRTVLERLAEWFFSHHTTRREAFERFVVARPELERYARFRATCDQRGKGWPAWPERLRRGALEAGDFSPEVEAYYRYTQWLAQEQIEHLTGLGRAPGVQLYLDLPLGVHPDSYDVWREQSLFATQASVGAPPDPNFTKGQDWGFPPLHPERTREQGYKYVIDYLRFQMRQTGMLRIDHVMGLHRLYWIPRGLPASEGAFMSYPAEELYAVLCLESHRHQTLVIGENLGTVPPEVNARMERHRLRQMYVLQYALCPNPRRALSAPPRASAASINTHDMPTFAAFRDGLDLNDRADLGLIPRGQLRAQRQNREQLVAALAKFLHQEGSLPEGAGAPVKTTSEQMDLFWACLRWLARSSAELVLINLEDLWGEMLPQNVPGTSCERPNWRRKARYALDRILEDPGLHERLAEVNKLRRRASGQAVKDQPGDYPSARKASGKTRAKVKG